MAAGLGLNEPLLETSDRCAIAGGVKRARPAAGTADADHHAAETGSARRRVTGWPV